MNHKIIHESQNVQNVLIMVIHKSYDSQKIKIKINGLSRSSSSRDKNYEK